MSKNKSIIQSDDSYCFIHMKYMGVEVPAKHKHHCIHGVANRKIAEREGVYCFLCLACHTALHDKGFHDKDLQKIAEQAWLDYYNKTIEDWIRVFGKNYLD